MLAVIAFVILMAITAKPLREFIFEEILQKIGSNVNIVTAY